jgi:ABC-type sugar transport system ATPase subunit
MIRIENVSKYYKKEKVFENFSLDIQRGERIVLFAKSGSGKTTLLRMIAGLDSCESGKIFIDNVLLTDGKEIIVPPEERGIGMVFQDLALWPHLNVGENITLALKVKGVAKKEREDALQLMLQKIGLVGFEDKKVYELSGGEQQRVALARTLIVKPKIVLMDEPLSSLDSELNARLRTEILRLQQEYGFTLIYVTHNEEEAKFLATQIVAIS